MTKTEVKSEALPPPNHSRFYEYSAYAIMIVMTVAQNFTGAIPLQLNVGIFSLACIVAGTYRSMFQMCDQFKTAYIDAPKEGEEKEGVEIMSKKDAMQFPFFAGGMLCALYVTIKYFGKDVVNKVFMFYLSLAIAGLFKNLLMQFVGTALDKHPLVDFKIKMIGLEVRISKMDIIGFILSGIVTALYLWTDNWMLNNLIAIAFSVHAIEMLFLGNF